MANIKQKYIKPGRDYNYSEGVKVKAGEAIASGDMVAATSYDGPFMVVSKADHGANTTRRGRLFMAKHAIASGSFGVVLPWKLVTGVDTSAGAVGDWVYLGDAGAPHTFGSAPGSSEDRKVGTIITDHASTGAWLFTGEGPGEPN